jgi:glycosyltransferase involved in cell wall biosynthesis
MSSNRSVNPYTYELYRHMPGDEIVELTLGFRCLWSALTTRYDVLHLHWLERAFWAHRPSALPKRLLLIFLIVGVVRVRGARFLWTVHDPRPHEMPSNRVLRRWPFSWLWRAFRTLVFCNLDGLVFQVEDHRRLVLEQEARLGRKPFITSPHPHFAGSYPDDVDARAARAALGLAPDIPVIGFVGNIRPYKNVDALIEAFRASDLRAALIVAGQVDDPAHQAVLHEAVRRDDRVVAKFEFIPDDRLQYLIKAADVLVLPFKAPTTSGSAMLGLSFACPIAVPASPVFRDLQAKVGSEWVYLFEGPVSPAVLADLLEWTRRPRAAAPDLSEFSWATAAQRTHAFMEALVAQKASPRAPAP